MSDQSTESSVKENPWATPRQTPVKGVVQPRIIAPFGKPTRHTNKLDYILTTVIKEAQKHKHVWPFLKPVDAMTLGIPLYHEKIKRPMDLKTVENRIKNIYYTCAQECIDDIEQIFQNCYIFNGTEDDVTIMAQNVHAVMKKALEGGPSEEKECEPSFNKKKKVKSERMGAGSDDRRKKEGSSVRGSEPPSEAGSETGERYERKSAGKTMKTAPKRKAVDDDDEEDKKDIVRPHKREASMKKPLPTVQLTGRLKFCQKLLNEFFAKKYHDIAWVFYEPVNAEKLQLHDYHTIIKHPMDMATIKEKLSTGQYSDHAEFHADMKLMLNNCMKYNPAGDPIYMMGQKYNDVFDRKWRDLPPEKPIGPSSSSTSTKEFSTPSGSSSQPSKVSKSSISAPIKQEIETSISSGGKSRSEEMMRLDNALAMVRDRESKLKSELRQVEEYREKLTQAKRAKNEDGFVFPDHLVNQAKIFCQKSSSGGGGAGLFTEKSAGGTSGHSSSGTKNQNGKGSKKSTTSIHGYEFDSDSEESHNEMSYEDKRNLSILINKLPPDHLSTIVSIIERREASFQPKANDDSEIEIDFEALGTMCLREMEAFARHVLNIPKVVKSEVKAEKMTPVKSSTTPKTAAPTVSQAAAPFSGPVPALPPKDIGNGSSEGKKKRKQATPSKIDLKEKKPRRKASDENEMTKEQTAEVIANLEKEIGQINTCIIKSTSGKAFLNNRPSVLLKRMAGNREAIKRARNVEKESQFNMSESSDSDATKGKKKKASKTKETSDSGSSSSSSDDDSEDDYTGESMKERPRQSGMPPSREWGNRIGGTGSAPASGMPSGGLSAARVPPLPRPSAASTTTSTAGTTSSQPHQVLKNSSSSSKFGKSGTEKSNSNPVTKTILDDLLPDAFAPSNGNKANDSSKGENMDTGELDEENEDERIERRRQEARRARAREDENSIAISNQMEMMSQFEYDNTLY